MYESKSDYFLQKSCCCVNKNQEKSPIKEISNPMPLDSIFRSDTLTNSVHSKPVFEGTKTPNNSTFPRTARKALPQIPSEQLDKIDIFMNQMKGTLYQEIVDDDKPNVNHHKTNRSNLSDLKKHDEAKKQIDLIFITSRILVGYSRQPFRDENNKVLRSLRHQYKKYLKIFHLNIRSTIDDQDKTSQNTTVSSLPYLMPFLDDIYNLLSTMTTWLQKSKKNVVLLNCSDKSNHLCAICVRFIIMYEDINKRLLRIENLTLPDHEANALQYYEKVNMEKYHTPSLKRYTSTITNIMLNIVQYEPNLKHLHIIVLKNIHPVDRHYEGIKDQTDTDTGWKLRSIYLNVYQNFHLIYSTYRITLNDEIETDRIIYIIEPIIPINGDILIIANVTNKSGFQSIYFRLQFHTCLLHGDVASFKNSELDTSKNKDFQSRKIGFVELHLKNQSNTIRDHKNMLLLNKYFVVQERISQSKDIFNQLKLLEQSDKGSVPIYTAGPVDGNLYAAIPRSMKTTGIISKYENELPTRTILKCPGPDNNTPFILRKFHNLEKEITNAAELISVTSSPQKKVPGHKPTKSVISSPGDNQPVRVSSMKTVKNQQRSFLPYRKSLSLSNSELPVVQSQKCEREYFVSYSNSVPKKVIDANHKSAKVNANDENSSPYDNLFPNNTVDQPSRGRDIYEGTYNGSIRSHESNYELVSHVNEVESREKFLSNLNEPRDVTDCHESIKNDKSMPPDSLNNKINSEVMLYDNDGANVTKEVYNVLIQRSLWFKPNFTRHDAILYLLDQPVGSFIIRTSTSLSKSLSIVVKCSTSILNKDVIENDSLEHIRHFIIDYNTEGYKIRGFVNERYYPDLTRLIFDHLERKIGLPCVLVLPSGDREDRSQLYKEDYSCQDRYLHSNISSTIISNYNVIYLGSFITKHLSDITAISASVDTLQARVCEIAHEYASSSLAKMSLRITHDRIIFTDLNRKMFFRKHCKLEDILCCEVDPKRRVWGHMSGLSSSSTIPSFSPIFGLVSCLTTNSEFSNQTCCQLFLAVGYDAEDICTVINKAKNSINR